MKKLTIKAGIAVVAAIALSSCAKDYSCDCEIVSFTPAVIVGGIEQFPIITDTTGTITIMRYSKKKAETKCEDRSSVEPVGTSTTTITTTCKITN